MKPMQAGTGPVKQIVWVNLIFFALTTLGAVIGAPLYIARYGISLPEVLLFAFYMVVTGLSITVGYHRMYAHATFKANPIVHFFVLFFGAAAFEQSALKWASQHREHHLYVDTNRDPYSIKKGFFYAHIGWLIFWDHFIDFDNVKDLQKNRMVTLQHKYFEAWATLAGILTPVLIGALTGHALGALVFAVCCRITLVYHATFCINSVCHMFGKATYDIYSTAKDHWFVAMMTYGEGYHNFHHRFPSDYRNAVLWYQWDPSKWTIALLEKIGFAWDVKRVSRFRILEARLAAEHQRANDTLKVLSRHPALHAALDMFRERHRQLKQNLVNWEHAAKAHQAVLQAEVARHSQEIRKSAKVNLRIARRRFHDAHEQWTTLVNRHPLDLERVLVSALS